MFVRVSACPRRHRHWCFFIEHCAHKLCANNDCNTIYSSNDYENNANLSPYIRCTVHTYIFYYFKCNAIQFSYSSFGVGHSVCCVYFFFSLSVFLPRTAPTKAINVKNALRAHTHFECHLHIVCQLVFFLLSFCLLLTTLLPSSLNSILYSNCAFFLVNSFVF